VWVVRSVVVDGIVIAAFIAFTIVLAMPTISPV
jgi:hypothetical protein